MKIVHGNFFKYIATFNIYRITTLFFNDRFFDQFEVSTTMSRETFIVSRNFVIFSIIFALFVYLISTKLKIRILLSKLHLN